MKNITVSIDEHTHRQARIRAAELGTSVSALVRDYLNRLVAEPPEEKVTVQRSQRLPWNVAADFKRGCLQTFEARGVRTDDV